ncbi:MAG: DUF4386 domain-containing protein, partial [Candidatus Promineifilaceae bacterium]
MNANSLSLPTPKTQTGGATAQQHRLAHLAGAVYLVIILTGMFAEFFVRAGLIVPGDAAATASNIVANESLFRANITADLIMIVADIIIGLLFYLIFRPVNRGLALLTTFFRLAQATILGANLLNLFYALMLFKTAEGAAEGAAGVQALGMMFLEGHGIGYTIALLFFGINLLILGYLVIKSGYFPQILGVLLIVAAVAYIADTIGMVQIATYADYSAIIDTAVLIPAFIA